MEIYQLITLCVILFFAAMVQSMVGFAFTLVALPFLLFAGWPLPQAVAVSTIGSTIQRLMIVSHLRNEVDWWTLRPMMIVGLIFLPIGIFVLREVSFLSRDTVKQIVGFLIISVLAVQWFAKIEPREAISKGWGYLSAALSGLLTGFANIGGPPIILWILAHRWQNEKMRVTSLAFTLAFVPFQIILLPMIFGKSILIAFLSAIVLTPIIYLSTKIGLRVGSMLSRRHLRMSMQGLLFLIAMISILKPILGR